MMIRDTFFSMPRFINLCRKEMVENWRVNLLRWATLFGILVVAFVWKGVRYSEAADGFIPPYWGKEDPVWNFEMFFTLAILYFMAMLSASLIMERMKGKTGRTAMLMTPATQFEKFLVRWLVFTVGYLISFLIAWRLADCTRVLIYKMIYPELEQIRLLPLVRFVSDGHNSAPFNNTDQLLLGVFGFLFNQSLFVLGGVLWPKNSFVKTVVALMIVLIVYVSIGGWLANMLLSGHYFQGSLDEDFMGVGTFNALLFLLTLFNWALAYFRFRESEVIHRW